MSEKIKSLIKNEFQGWKLWELLWLAISVLTVSIISFFTKDNLLGIIGAICGITASVLTGKGKISAYIIGGIGRVCYAVVALNAKFYGELVLNLFYFVPMEFYGIYVWSKSMNLQTHEVEKKRLNGRQMLFVFLIIAVLTISAGFILKHFGGNLPFTDAFTNAASVIAMLLTIKRFSQQWLLWLIINAVSTGMWIFSAVNGNGSSAILLMWIIYLLNSIFMLVKWTKEARQIQKE